MDTSPLLPVIGVPQVNPGLAEIDYGITIPYDNGFELVEEIATCRKAVRIFGTVGHSRPRPTDKLLTKVYVSMVDADTNEIFADNMLVTQSTLGTFFFDYRYTFLPPRRTRISRQIRITIDQVI